MASSNDTLFGLAANLQSMENNLNDFIFHCALRLSSMTDSKVFILMDNPNVPGGRQYGGSRELVEEYSNHGLRLHLGSDIEIELNPDNPPVRRKQQFQNQSHQQRMMQQPTLVGLSQHSSPFDIGGGGGGGGGGGVGGSSMKRGWNSTQHSNSNENFVSTSSPPKRRRSKASDSLKVDSVDKSKPSQCKLEVEEFIIDSDSEDFAPDHPDGIDKSATYQDSFNNDQNAFNSLASANSFAISSSSQFESPSQKVGLDVPMLREKERALAGVKNHVAAFVKGTVENKLLASTMYDAGKAMTLTNPHPLETDAFREDFNARLQAYVDEFPQFVAVPITAEATALVVNFNKDYSPISYLKMNARNGYKRGVKALQKQRENAGQISQVHSADLPLL